MSLETLSAYTEYIKSTLEEVRRLKQEGYDVSECNRLLQSLVSSILNGDLKCADFLINELQSAIMNLKHTVPHLGMYSGISPSLVARDQNLFYTQSIMLPEEKFRYVYTRPPIIPLRKETPSKALMFLLYVSLLLFVIVIFTFIATILNLSWL